MAKAARAKRAVAGPAIHKGLAGLVVDESAISRVDPETNSLTYYGYPVQDLARHCTFEEVAYLLANGELPGRAQLSRFRRAERALREIDRDHVGVIARFSRAAHPMDTLRTAVSYLGTREIAWGGEKPAADKRRAMALLAKIPTMIATDYRFRNAKRRIRPRDDLSFSENFHYMCFARKPAPEVVRALDTSLILYAEHGFNASTFAARVVASTLSDIYSAVTAAIGALKGPLHGGANEAVMYMLAEIGAPERAEAWIRHALVKKRLIMGFGHRVYRTGDSRVPTMNTCLADLSAWKEDDKWLRITETLARVVIAEKGIHPNLDFPSGPAYDLMGFDIDLFTPIFVMSRITGWSAHYLEQIADNRLIRPLSAYTGPAQRKVRPLARR